MKQALIVVDVQESFRRRPYFQEPDLPPQQLIMPTELIRRESVRQVAAGHSYVSSLALQEHTL